MNMFNTLQRNTPRLLVPIVLGAILLASTPALAQDRPQNDGSGDPVVVPHSSDAVSRHLWRLLSAHHTLPTREDLLRHIEASFVQEGLRAIASNPELFVLQRRRALLALTAYWPESQASTNLLQEVLEGATAQPDLYHEAIHALLTRDDEAGRASVESYLKGADAARCKAAYEALATRGLVDATSTCATTP